MTKKRWGLAAASIAVLAVASVHFLRSNYSGNPSTPENYDHDRAAARDRQPPTAEEQADLQETGTITGQMTLAELQRHSGIPASIVADRLNLPYDVPTDEPLGRLRQRYPFTMDHVRDIVAELSEGLSASDPSRAVEQSAGAKQQTDPHKEEEHLTIGRGAEDQSGILITGQMSLRDIETRSGVSARLIAQGLGLSPNVSLDTQLGQLRRTHRFTMQQVREVVSDLMKDRKTLGFAQK